MRKRKTKPLIASGRISVLHFNAERGYITYLEQDEHGEYKVRGILLDSEDEERAKK